MPRPLFDSEFIFGLNDPGGEQNMADMGRKGRILFTDEWGAEELAVGSEKLVTVIRTLGDQYFLALAMLPEGNMGRGRYNLRIAAPKILAELA